MTVRALALSRLIVAAGDRTQSVPVLVDLVRPHRVFGVPDAVVVRARERDEPRRRRAGTPTRRRSCTSRASSRDRGSTRSRPRRPNRRRRRRTRRRRRRTVPPPPDALPPPPPPPSSSSEDDAFPRRRRSCSRRRRPTCRRTFSAAATTARFTGNARELRALASSSSSLSGVIGSTPATEVPPLAAYGSSNCQSSATVPAVWLSE